MYDQGRWFLDLRSHVADFQEMPSLNRVIKRVQDKFKMS